MKYTYPNGFDLLRAKELAGLVDAAYDQLAQGAGWQPPTGYTMLALLSAKEIWKVPGPMLELVEKLLKPVPFGFVASKGNDLYVVIRGTQTPLEWLDDFTAIPVPFQAGGKPWGRTTRGFSLLYNDLGPQISQALTTFQTGGGSLASIFVTGHSLGAAMAHLASADIAAQYGVQPVSYTFCGPRAGDPDFATAFATARLTTWRMFNTEDLVPTVPPAAVRLDTPNIGMHGLTTTTQSLTQFVHQFVQLNPLGYQHIGYPIAVTFHAATVAGNHNLDSLIAELATL